MKRNIEIGELDRAILHHGLCLLGCEARRQEDKRLLEHVESLRLLLYPELENQPSGFASATPDKQSENQRASTVKPPQQQTPYKPTLPPLNTYQPPPDRQALYAAPLISDKQSKRLYAIQMKSGKKSGEVKDYLKSNYGFSSSKEITIDVYEKIINWIQGN
ncbi:MAG: hypothetical protein WCS96_07950 [Victivallales bacterium]|jgi:hypothetical protein